MSHEGPTNGRNSKSQDLRAPPGIKLRVIEYSSFLKNCPLLDPKKRRVLGCTNIKFHNRIKQQTLLHNTSIVTDGRKSIAKSS